MRTLFLLAALLGVLACQAPLQPQPIDHDEDEAGRHELRERWIESMHRAAPGVDWRAIEASNQAAQLAKRNAMRAQLSGPGAGMAGGHAWEEVGSRNQAGHTRCAALGPDRNGSRWLYVGSANGGLWRSPEDGSAWEPLSDELFGGVDEVVVLEPANLASDDIVIQRRGATVHRSDDGGLTWNTPLGLEDFVVVRHLIVFPDGNQTVFVFGRADVGSLGATRTTLFTSSDMGQTFSPRWISPTNWKGDVWVPRFGPGAGTDVYVLQAGKLRRSTDGGFNFSLVGTVNSSATEGSLQGSEAGAPHLYAALKVGGNWEIYRSADAGASWVSRGAPPQYWGAISSLASYSSDADALFTGGIEGWRSFDGGQSWTRVNTWGSYYSAPATRLHADLRGLSPIPDPDQLGVADLLFVNTDGGTYRSLDKGLNVWNVTLFGLGVGQFYSTHTSSKNADRIVGGTQDQGYQRGIRQPWTGGPSTNFDQLISGDYGHLNSGDGDHDFVFSTYPGFVLIQVGENNPSLDTEDFPAGASNLWLPPVLADPLDQEDFFFLGDQLWHYNRVGNDWVESLHSNRDFAAGAANYLSAMAFSPADAQRAYACDDAGRLWWSTDRGVTWTQAAGGGPDNHYFYGNGLAAHPTDPLRAVVCGAGYSSAGVLLTVDGGQTWSPMDTGLPATLAYDICWAEDGTGDCYAATEAGAWRYDAAAGQWVDCMGVEAPATTYWSVEAVPDDGLIRFGTYGRGIWDYLIGPPSSAVLFSDGFESGNFTAGGWTTSSNARCRIHANSSRTGSWGARLKKGGQAGKPSSITRAVDTTGWPNVTLEFSRESVNYEAHEFLRVEWFDGANWQPVEDSQDTDWGDMSFLLPAGAGNNGAFQIRFQANSKGKNERSNIDDVVVRGSL